MTSRRTRPAPVPLLAIALLALLASLLPQAVAQAATDDLRSTLESAEATPVRTGEFVPGESASGLWIVELDDTALSDLDAATSGASPYRDDANRLNADTPASRDARADLSEVRAEAIGAVAAEIGRQPQIAHQYDISFNGFSVEVDAAEARRISALPGVARVQPDFTRQLTTDAGPEFINALTFDLTGDTIVYDGEPGSPALDGVAPVSAIGGNLGEGVVVGILDTGIAHANPSFAETVGTEVGGDGYVHTWEGDYYGVCAPTLDDDPDLAAINALDPICNDKLIGAWNLDPASEFGARDDDGHGSHTASTAAGNQVRATVSSGAVTDYVTIAGVAPHANIISYKVCLTTAGCSGAAILAGIQQAIVDQVDVINYSIGSTAPGSPWSDLDTLAFLDARDAGIFVATSNGNSGPLPATVGSPAGAPWMISVGASQHNRSYVQSITVAGEGVDTLVVDGKGFTPGLDTPSELVYAGDFGNALCGPGDFDSGTDFTGQIVICDRGEFGRVQKSEVVAALGAAGYILANDELNAASLSSDAFAVPGVHVSDVDGAAMKALVEAGPVSATISETAAVTDDSFGNLQASFSSRGPNRSADYLNPDVTAPGVDIIAAVGIATEENSAAPIEWGFLSGTSMSSPHVAGAGAALADLTDWTPAEIQSALMLTARTADLVKEDGITPADPFDYGAGYIDVAAAAQSGLIMDITTEEYLAADPAEGGDPTALNAASFSNQDCLATCGWTRSFEGTVDDTYTVSIDPSTDPRLSLSTDVATLSAVDGELVELTVTADVTGAPIGEAIFGSVILTPTTGPVLHLPVAVTPSAGIIPDAFDIVTRRDAGSRTIEGLQTIGADPLVLSYTGLTGGDTQDFSVVEDDTNDDPFDGNGTVSYTVDIAEGDTRAIFEILESTSPDLDLFVGTGDTPSGDTLIALSASGTALEKVDLAEPAPGTYWVLIQNWDASSPGGTDDFTIATAIVAGDEGNLTAAPSNPSPALNTPYDLDIAFDLEMTPGQTYYGSVTLSDGVTDIGTIDLTVARLGDDVTKTVSVDAADDGDTVTYAIEVLGNDTYDEDITYDITDSLPEGVTLVPDSILVDGEPSDDVTVDGTTISWAPTQQTAIGTDGDYAMVTGAEDPDCVANFGYVDFEGLIPTQPGISGDTFAFSTFATGSPHSFYEDVYDRVFFTDNGYVPWAYDELVYDAAPLGDPTAPNSILAGFMQDLEVIYDGAAGAQRGIRIGSTGDGPNDLWLLDYDSVEPIGSDVPSSFQIYGVRTPSGAPGAYEYAIAFDDPGTLTGPVSIGVENSDGSRATSAVSAGDATGIVDQGSTFCFDYVGFTPESTILTFDATVDIDADTDVVNTATSIVTTDPASQPVDTAATFAADVAEIPGNPGVGAGPDPAPTDEPTEEPTDPAEPVDPTDPPTEEPTPGNPAPPASGDTERFEGESRIETAVDISQDLFPEDGSADSVILARADIPFDALAAAPVAEDQNGPLLLTTSDTLHPATAAEIDRVLADDGEVIILGGPAAIAESVVDTLTGGVAQTGVAVTRLFGASRVETALAVADFLGDPGAILIASADSFPDALASGAAAASADGVVVLTPEATFHPATEAYLAANDAVPTFAVGGQVAALVPDYTALAGVGREQTSVLVAQEFFTDPVTIGLARSDEFADALSGGAHAALTGGPVLLTNPDALSDDVLAYTCTLDGAAGYLYGGTAALSVAVGDAFLAGLNGEGCPS